MPPLPGTGEAITDTIGKLDQRTLGPSPGSDSGVLGGDKPSISLEPKLPTAQRLEDADDAPFAIRAEDNSPATRLRRRRPTGAGKGDVYRARRQRGTPMWLWAVLAGGIAIALILIFALTGT